MWKFLKQYFMPQYTSEVDQFLAHYDQSHSQLSTSQRSEKAKFQVIYQLRDGKKE